MGQQTPPCIARTCLSAAGGPEADGHATRRGWIVVSVDMPPGAGGSRRPWACHPTPQRGAPSSSFRVRQERTEESVLQRRAATPLMLLRRGIGRLVGCGMASSAWWRDQRSSLSKRMLRHGVGCLAEGLFERIPPLRAFGPPVGMTVKGGPAKPSGGLCRAGHGVCHKGHRGHRGNPAPSRLCGLCDSLWLALPLRAVQPVRRRAACVGWHGHALRGHGTMHGPASSGHAHPPAADQRRMGMPPG